MNPVISVAADALDVAGAVESLASLPASYRVGAMSGPRAGVVSGPGWMPDALAALAQGSDAVLVVSPGVAADPIAVEVIRETGRPVVIDDRWSHNPALATLAEAIGHVADAELLELGAHIDQDDDVAEAFVDLLVLADLLAGPLESIRAASVRADAMNATGIAAGSRSLLISVRRSAVGSGSARIRAVGRSQAVDAVIPSPSTAAPALVRLHGSDGIVHYPTVFESSHRAAWRALAEAVHTGVEVQDVPRRSRLIGLFDRRLVAEPPSKTGTVPGPANQEEKK